VNVPLRNPQAHDLWAAFAAAGRIGVESEDRRLQAASIWRSPFLVWPLKPSLTLSTGEYIQPSARLQEDIDDGHIAPSVLDRHHRCSALARPTMSPRPSPPDAESVSPTIGLSSTERHRARPARRHAGTRTAPLRRGNARGEHEQCSGASGAALGEAPSTDQRACR